MRPDRLIPAADRPAFLACVMLLAGLLLAGPDAARAEALLRGLGPEPDSLDIHLAQGLSSVNLLREVGEGLVTVDAAGRPAPGVALDWQRAADGLSLRFQLNPEARWSDGRPLTADDFVYAWRRAVNPLTASPTAQLLDGIENAREIREGLAEIQSLGIEALEPQVLEVRLQYPVPWLESLLSHPVTYPLPVPENTPAQGRPANHDPRLGPWNGAYTLAEWVPHARLVLQANPHWQGADSLALQQVIYIPTEDPAAELNRFRSGELHITETIPPGRFQWLQENLPGALRVHPYQGSFFLGLNLRQAELANSAQLRRALSLAIDREILTGKVLAAGESPAFTLVPPGIGDYMPPLPEEASLDQAAREKLAKQLYAASRHDRRQPLQLRINTSSTHRRMAVAVAAMWRSVLGVNTEIVNEEWKVFVANRRLGRVTEVFRGGWIADYPDPWSFLGLFQSGSELNWSGWSDDGYDALLQEASAISDPQQRLPMLAQAEALLLNDYALIPLYYYVSRHLVDAAVGGWVPNVQDVHLSRYLNLDGMRDEG